MKDNLAAKNWVEIHIASRKMIREEDRRRRSRPYWMADVLTTMRFIAAGVLLLMALAESRNVELALVIFGLGELTDAFDGPCARMWLYPDDGRYRWWRVHAPVIDQAADISLWYAAMAFMRPHAGILRICLLVATTTIIVITIQALRGWIEQKYGRQARRRIVLVRRVLYVAAVLGVCAWMIWLTGWSWEWKITLSYALLVLAVTLVIFKTNRLLEEKTPLVRPNVPEFLRDYVS